MPDSLQWLQWLGKYEILKEIGDGDFAVVYKARDTEIDRIVALKVLPRSYAGGTHGSICQIALRFNCPVPPAPPETRTA